VRTEEILLEMRTNTSAVIRDAGRKAREAWQKILGIEPSTVLSGGEW